MEILTKENYATCHDYLSYSRFSKFLRCEASAAVNFREPASVAQLVGSYVDAYFSEEMEDFKKAHPEIFNSKTGQLKTDFLKAEEIIQRIKTDEKFMKLLSGEKQSIMVGEIEGVPFKIKMDSYIPGKAIVDLKVMKDFNKVWSDAYRTYVNFMVAYDYDIEMAIFQEIVYQNTGLKLPCYIAAITKETPSDIGAFLIPQNKLDEALEIVKNTLNERIKPILNGEIAPHRCEKCYYCRATKKTRIFDWELVGFDGDKLREEGIQCDDPILQKKEEK